MADEEAVCLWTDPPYGVEYEGGTKNKLTLRNDSAEGLSRLLEESFAAMDAVLASGAAVYVAHPAGALSVTFSSRFLARGWRLHQTLVWGEDLFVIGHSDYHYRHEFVPEISLAIGLASVALTFGLTGVAIQYVTTAGPLRVLAANLCGFFVWASVLTLLASSGSSSLQPNAPGVFLIGATASIAEELPFGLN